MISALATELHTADGGPLVKNALNVRGNGRGTYQNIVQRDNRSLALTEFRNFANHSDGFPFNNMRRRRLGRRPGLALSRRHNPVLVDAEMDVGRREQRRREPCLPASPHHVAHDVLHLNRSPPHKIAVHR